MFLLMSLPFWLSNKLWWSINKLKHCLWWVYGGALFDIIFVYCVYFVYILYCAFDIDIWYCVYCVYFVYCVFNIFL